MKLTEGKTVYLGFTIDKDMDLAESKEIADLFLDKIKWEGLSFQSVTLDDNMEKVVLSTHKEELTHLLLKSGLLDNHLLANVYCNMGGFEHYMENN